MEMFSSDTFQPVVGDFGKAHSRTLCPGRDVACLGNRSKGCSR